MSLAALQNYPSTPTEFVVWSFAHQAHHRDIIRRITELHSENLTSFVLDPFDPNDMGGWIEHHRIMHEQMDTLLKIPSYDLTGLDWSDREATADWLQKNYYEHSIASQLLKIG